MPDFSHQCIIHTVRVELANLGIGTQEHIVLGEVLKDVAPVLLGHIGGDRILHFDDSLHLSMALLRVRR